MVIVDEASMIDLVLFYHLLKAIPAYSHLLLVGDVDQLPSVGAGNVLRDVIDSGLAHVTRLDTIFRQSEDSLIVLNAHRVNHGEMPYIHNRSADFFFFKEEDPERAAELVVDIVLNRLPSRFGVDPMREVQVIAPMYRGPVGVNALNDALQTALNGNTRQAEKRLGGRLFRAGDKVMQIRNNYEKDVFNGDIGFISGIDYEDNQLEVVLDGRFIYYDFTEADELTLAYCISTHRSQGGEYPIVVIPLLTQHYMMLQRNLLYTAITRARKTVVLVGTSRAIHIAVHNNKVSERYSGLLPRLRA
jgi:exodeoxyribonuclease V alpha subunit